VKNVTSKYLLVGLLLVVVVAAVLLWPREAGLTFTAGTYEASAMGFNADIRVEVVVDRTAIKSIRVVEHRESPLIADVALLRIPAAVVAGQTVAVDAVAGATVTSRGLLTAITDALTKAGGNLALLQTRPAAGPPPQGQLTERRADVVVIGGGGAGLAAAVEAHQNGATVIVLEKMPRIGGNTIISGGAFNAVEERRQKAQGIEDSVERHFTQTYEGGDRRGNPELIRILVENAAGAVKWLEELGMKFQERVFTVPGGMWARAIRPEMPLGTGFIDTLGAYIEREEGIEVLLETTATELILEGGRVVGVKTTTAAGPLTVRANNAVIIATGGFGANVEMRDKVNTVWPTLTSIKTTNHPGATGDGIRMAEVVGARVVGLEQIQLLPLGDPRSGSLAGSIGRSVDTTIYVNKEGQRFVNEGARRDVMTMALMQQRDAILWEVVDRDSYPTGDTRNNFDETIDTLVTQGRAFRADSLEELARLIGVNPANLVQTVAEFNAAVDRKGGDAFGRTLFGDKIDTAPFYAASRAPTVHHTMGGIEINARAEVINQNGQPIAGLFAAGEVTGGIHGSNRLGGNALPDTIVFGRIAGRNAAAARR